MSRPDIATSAPTGRKTGTPSDRAAPTPPLLEVANLRVGFAGGREAVAGIDYTLDAGRTLGVVGESGSGKTMAALALLGLVPPPGTVSGSIRFAGRELLGQDMSGWQHLRGNRIAMVFQEPATALNPMMPIGRQIAEALVVHGQAGWRAAAERAVGLLDAVGIPEPQARARAYPHELSGGMRQRAMIAIALACEPDLLIADEPTTALDVTIEAQILDLILDLQDRTGMAIQFISHNLAVVSAVADEIVVMYAGRIVEQAPADILFADPRHPYTQGLIATLPQPDHRVDRLPTIAGSAAQMSAPGCRFADRCPLADPGCRRVEPAREDVAPSHSVACFKA